MLMMILYTGHFSFDGYLYIELLPIPYYQNLFLKKIKRWENPFVFLKENRFNAKATDHPD